MSKNMRQVTVRRRIAALLVSTALMAAGAPVRAQHAHQDDCAAPGGVRLQTDLGRYSMPISAAPRAQRFFDQGLALAYGFNHAAAAASFAEAARLDPNCAGCQWGIALVQGPNINAPMADAAVPVAYQALQAAQQLSPRASAREQALIAALAHRYAPAPVADRSALDQAYAVAMRAVAQQFPRDPDVLTLTAEALMDLHPWDFYTSDGQPKSWTAEIVRLLEQALALSPDHAGANHYYIHAVEASATPERALPSAERLGRLVPGAGHLVHMAAHIYLRLGRYHDAVAANQRAIAVDRPFAACGLTGVYPAGYVPHNHHFLWAAAMMEGRSQLALGTARTLAATATVEAQRHPAFGAFMQNLATTPMLTMVRFGRWDDILALPQPPVDLRYATAIWHYARGLAFVRTGRRAEAEAARVELAAIGDEPALATLMVGDVNSATAILAVATASLAGEVAAARRDFPAAVAALEDAVRRQDALRYMEPPPWYMPTRQALGEVLMRAGRAADAERVYREDLRRNPENGWSLFGLGMSLDAQGKRADAGALRQRLAAAWRYADVGLSGSRF
jgi:tetratricopeptide (TPR) repeat protein